MYNGGFFVPFLMSTSFTVDVNAILRILTLGQDSDVHDVCLFGAVVNG